MFKSLVVFLHNPFNYYQVRHTHLTRMKYRDLKKQQWTCWLKRLNNNHTSKRGRCRNSLELDPRNSGSQHTAWQTLILFLLYFLNKCLFGCDEYNVWKLIPPHRVMTIWYPSRLQWVIGYRGPWRTQVVLNNYISSAAFGASSPESSVVWLCIQCEKAGSQNEGL